MSLIRHAIRIATVKALMGRTEFGDNVLDSQNGTLDVDADNKLVTDQDKPCIGVYVYDGKAEHERDKDLHGAAVFDLALEMIYSTHHAVRDENDEVKIVEGVLATDANREFMLELVGAQIRKALTDPANAWAEIWRGLVTGIAEEAILATRHSSGQRVAGHQILWTVMTIRAPRPNDLDNPNSVYGSFLAALEASEDSADQWQAAKIREVITTGDQFEWQELQRQRGITAAHLRALGHGPIAQDVDRETPPFSTGTLHLGDGRPATSVSEPD